MTGGKCTVAHWGQTIEQSLAKTAAYMETIQSQKHKHKANHHAKGSLLCKHKKCAEEINVQT